MTSPAPRHYKHQLHSSVCWYDAVKRSLLVECLEANSQDPSGRIELGPVDSVLLPRIAAVNMHRFPMAIESKWAKWTAVRPSAWLSVCLSVCEFIDSERQSTNGCTYADQKSSNCQIEEVLMARDMQGSHEEKWHRPTRKGMSTFIDRQCKLCVCASKPIYWHRLPWCVIQRRRRFIHIKL